MVLLKATCSVLYLAIMVTCLENADSFREISSRFTYSIPVHCGRNAFDDKWARLFTKKSSWQMPKRIVGGTESAYGEWPWLVSFLIYQNAEQVRSHKTRVRGLDEIFVPPTMLINYPDGSRMFHICGGTLIHPKWIISAAHCFRPNQQYPDLSPQPKRWLARVGEHDMLDKSVPHYDMTVKRIIVHPEYTDRTRENDIALIELNEELPLGPQINVACLPAMNEKPVPNRKCFAAGWGHSLHEAKNITTVLHHVEVPVIAHSKCSKLYSLDGVIRIYESMVCAGSEEGGKDACQFDSGGPLVCKVSGQWRLIGVVSFGVECGLPEYPGVYTDVSYFVPWIQAIVREPF
ncbi:hypothetical protein CRM22_007807 [Opisthorchis felineus]|uniref:Peptidase S1 domain-containing protein n=1 Tax=Opisthorchis felineus TaxID=147828 RepID=A0A4S2LDZ6_OPIFE|nr:hypothetical protein CRM22_007807 [Opisthorchis felineus]